MSKETHGQMVKQSFNSRIDELFRKCEWEKARKLLELELKRAPQSHWVLTQLGVTFYEQRKYDEACRLFLKSLKIVPDCPLTLWNLAGALDAIGKPSDALEIYKWLIWTEKSVEDDPCWESDEWTEALKADSVFRIGVCFQHIGNLKKADRFYRHYLDRLLAGSMGTYTIDDVTRRIRELHEAGKPPSAAGDVQRAMRSALKGIGRQPRGNPPPVFDERDFFSGQPADCK